MRRTTAAGNDGNRYTEGNPSMGIPATTVSAEAANGWQEEIVNTIEEAGLTPSTDEDQLLEAIKIIASKGGDQITPFAIANAQAATAVTGLLFDKTVIKSVKISYSIDRHTASSNVQSSGTLHCLHDATDDVWRIEDVKSLDDDGVTFTIDATGQVKYASSNLAGASYAGLMYASVSKLYL